MMPSYRTSVVRLVAYRREEYLDRHQPHASTTGDQRPFLLLLSPDTLELVTASDATDSGPAAASLVHQGTLKPSDRTPRRHTVRPLALLHKLAHGHATPRGEGDEAGTSAGGSPAADARDNAAAAGMEGLGGELEEGQLLTFSIALSQVADVECDEKRIKLLFCRQRPHKSTASNDEWKAVWKAMAFPVAFPIEGWKHRNFSVKGFMNRHYRDPFVSSVVLEADSPQEAAALHRSIEAAIARLSAAVHWLSQDLPLDSKPVITLVTATAPGSEGGGGSYSQLRSGPWSDSEDGLGGGCASPLASPGLAAAAGVDLGSEQIVSPFPRLQQPLDIPAVAAAGSAGAAELQVHVWLHSPLGPAVATITEAQLRQSAETCAPLCVTATAHRGRSFQHGQQPAPQGTAASANHLQVVLQFTALRRAPPSRRISAPPVLPANGGAAVSSSWTAMLAVLAVPLLAAWPQLLAGSAFPAIRVLQSVAFLVSCLAALAAIVVLQLKGRVPVPEANAQAVVEGPQAAAPAGWWRLVLLHADLVQETRQAGAAGAPPVQRVVSSSPRLSHAPSASLPLDGSALELPPAITRLVLESPHILTEDIAARFLLGLGHADKAYEALSKMVLWVESEGVADLVHQPQPRFELIKKHYPQVFYSFSKVADCILEVECTGQWRAAFDSLKALGVTDRELLRHQFFCMEYAFRVLDTRPLPQGKTVKIIDLAGLSMRDVSSAAFKWYLQVGGALLAVNYPQRLHKAFLLNAPAWSGVIWKVLAAVIPRGIRDRLQLFTKKQGAEAARALLQWVPAEQLPAQYGGSCLVPLGESELELEMLEYVRRLNQQGEQQQQQGLLEQNRAQSQQQDVGGPLKERQLS